MPDLKEQKHINFHHHGNKIFHLLMYSILFMQLNLYLLPLQTIYEDVANCQHVMDNLKVKLKLKDRFMMK